MSARIRPRLPSTVAAYETLPVTAERGHHRRSVEGRVGSISIDPTHDYGAPIAWPQL
jgi:hypothetical protein